MVKTGPCKSRRLPTFLVAGVAKAGTTSIAHYLAAHPEVYICPKKETMFFSPKRRGSSITSFQDYEKLFAGVRTEKAIGEIGTGYLYYHQHAIEVIRRYLGDVTILIILRNPVERAFSSYMHFVRDRQEPLSFEEALREEETRLERDFMWHYTRVGFYAEALRDYKTNFSRVHVLFYEDLVRDPARFMRSLYKKIGVDSSFVPPLNIRHNMSGVPRFQGIHRLLHGLLTKPFLIKSFVKRVMGTKLQRRFIGLLNMLINKNLGSKPRIKPETRRNLRELYRQDILEVSRITGRDLSEWLE